MIKAMVIALGSGLPAYLAWAATGSQGVLTQFWSALVAFSVGWFLSRKFVRDHLNL